MAFKQRSQGSSFKQMGSSPTKQKQTTYDISNAEDKVRLAKMYWNTGGVRKGGDGGKSYRKRFGPGTDGETAYKEVMSSPELKELFNKD